MTLLRRLFGFSRRYVVMRRDVKVKWTKADAAYLKSMLESNTWKKLATMSDDSMICDLLPGPAGVPNPEEVSAFVAGRVKQLEFIYLHAGMKRLPFGAQEEEEGNEQNGQNGIEEETMPIQIAEG